MKFQSLFYWITYSYSSMLLKIINKKIVSILILLDYLFLLVDVLLTHQLIGVSILILLDYLFLLFTILLWNK